MFRKALTLAASAALLAALAATAAAQSTGGAVTGAVVDQNGGVVPNATVTLRNKATGQAPTVQTTGSGVYSFPVVPVGEYTLTAEAAGFAPVSAEVRVSLNQTTSVDVTLNAAGVSENVEVTAAGEALVQSDTSQLGRSYETRLVQNLPTFGNQNTLALLSPNVVARGAGTLGTGGSVGGTRARSNVFTVDGVDNNDPGVTGPAVAVVQDAVGEFTLLTNNFNAEFGGGGGGQFVTITRSGTNEFHGSAFVYRQDQSLNAASSTEETQLQSGEISEKPRFRDTRFGLTFGGPIRKNKLFFFGAYEKDLNSSEGGADSFLAPTAVGLEQIATLPGASPFVVNYLRRNLTLAPAQTTTQTVLGTQGVPFGLVTINVPVGFNQDLAQLNLDHQPDSQNQFRYRFNLNNLNQEQAGGGNPAFNNLIVYQTKLFSATWVRSFGSSVVNDLRLSYRQVKQDFPLKNEEFLTLPNVVLPAFNLDLGPGGNLPQNGSDNVYQIYDSLNYIRGQHNFKLGGEYKRVLTNQSFLPRGRGEYIYNNFDALLRDLTPGGRDAIRGVGSGSFAGNLSKYSLFFQDDWKVTPNLTLNLGVRYEYATLPRDVLNQELNRISDVPGVIEFGVPPTDKNNWAPRVGFAYSPDFEGGFLKTLFGGRGRSSIRGNFAVAYSDVFQNLVSIQLPPQVQQELTPAIAVARFGFNAGAGFLERGGLPANPAPPVTVAAARGLTGGVVSNLTSPYTMSFALSVQRELTPTMAVEFRYLGTRSRKLPVQTQRNAAFVNPGVDVPTFLNAPSPAQLAGLPTLGSIINRDDVLVGPLDEFGFPRGVTDFLAVGNAQYDSGSVNVTRRFSRGLAFTASYTFSKTIDDSTNELNSSAVNARRPEDGFNLRNERGLSANDIPHRFVVAGNYELPFFRDSRNEAARFLLGGFELAGIFQAQSGQPFTPRSAIDSNLNADAAGDRAILNPSGAPGTGSRVCPVNAAGQLMTGTGATTVTAGGVTSPVTLANCGLGFYGPATTVAYVAVNPNAQFIQAGFGARTTSGRNVIRSNGFNRTDMTLLKNFRFGDDARYNVQVGAEVFNLFNQRIRTLGTATGSQSSIVVNAPSGVNVQGAFANVNSAFFNDYSTGVFGGRTVQLRGKFIF